MPLLLIAAFFVGAIALSSRSTAAPAPQRAIAAGGAPSPIVVLCAHLRADCEPPPFVVHCAITEARRAGRPDLADIFGQLLEPGATTSGGAHASRAVASSAAPQQPSVAQPGDDQTIEMPPVLAPSPAPLAFEMQGGQGDAGPQVSVPVQPAVAVSSPISGISDDAWSHFCGQLVRESPGFISQRNVGRYRHRKDRLAQIGFDPDSIVGSTDAQDAAWNADLADAHRHLAASGM